MAAILTEAGKKAREISKVTGLAERRCMAYAKGDATLTEPVRRCLALADWCKRSGHDFQAIVAKPDLTVQTPPPPAKEKAQSSWPLSGVLEAG